MKKILFCFIFLFSIITILYGEEYQEPISKYKQNYFIFGNSEDQTKFQLSLKADIIYPFNTGILFGYTQTTWWKVYNGADTMSSNYQPEVFFRVENKKNIFGNADLGYIDYFQISPFYHCSTGVEGVDHRSINLYYAQVQVSLGDRFNIGDNLKVFGYYNKSSQNSDIEKYKGYYENDVFAKIFSSVVPLVEFHFKHGGTLNKGWLACELQTVFFTDKFQPKLFFQYFYGYGENMVFYNKKDKSFYVGLIF
ncbi:MAG TPA: phospholipase A [Candidatus Paceibacterota bacterium]|nr:phospholipase A [Candidatus Paceibacterota bacterium]